MQTYPQPLWFGRYRLSARIATGGMAEVFAGRHVSEAGVFGPMVAVKRLLPHFVNDAAVVQMFLNEARITAQVSHPNVVQIFELGQVDGEPFMAMELLEGHTLEEVRLTAAKAGRRVPTALALRVFIDACHGLDTAHKAVDDTGTPLSLVHRDFTPDNIHIGVNGHTKVIDFGVARTQHWSSGTEPGILKGKFFYMSPEMVTGKAVDHRADLFAAGIMLYEQLCGKRPFPGKTIEEVVKNIAAAQPVPPSQVDVAAPALLEAISLKALHQVPDERFSSLLEFARALEDAGQTLGLASQDDVAAFMSELFPEAQDETRTTMRLVRENDLVETGALVPNESLVPLGFSGPQATPPTATAALVAPQRQDSASVKRPDTVAFPSKSRRVLLAAAVTGLVALGLAGGFLYQKKSAVPVALAQVKEASAENRLALLNAWALQPSNPKEQWAQAAQLFPGAAPHEEKLEFAERWVSAEANSVKAHLFAGEVALKLKRFKRVEMAIAEASRCAPDDFKAATLLAQYREALGDAAGALEAWALASKRNGKDAQAWHRQGYWLSQSGRLDEASAALEKGLALRFDARAAAELGFVRFREQRFPDALKLLQKAVKADPNCMEARYYLASSLYQKGDIDKARAQYAKATLLAPDDERPWLAWCQMETQQKTTKIDAVKKDIQARFKAGAPALIARCEAAVF
jgi:eukaryotic-like serine/threonine-protein kinase